MTTSQEKFYTLPINTMARPIKVKDEEVIGRKFNKLLVIESVISEKKWRRFNCKCDCWNEKEIAINHIISGKTQSCWCHRNENGRRQLTTHNMFWTRFYIIWRNMKSRCDNVRNKRYNKYWLRWITYDKRWNEFEIFMQDLYESYIDNVNKYWEKNTTIDRIDVDWNYCIKNIKRSNRKEQANNRTSSRYIEVNWVLKTLATWLDVYDIKEHIVRNRLKRWITWEALFLK